MTAALVRRPLRKPLAERRFEIVQTIGREIEAHPQGGADFESNHLALIGGLAGELGPEEIADLRLRTSQAWSRARQKAALSQKAVEVDVASSVLEKPKEAAEPKPKLKPSDLLINPKAGREVSSEVIQRAMVPFNPVKNPFSSNGFENGIKALELMEFDCAMDLFHGKPIIKGQFAWMGGDGFADLDNVVLKLRSIVIEQFGFDPTEKGTRDALRYRCNENGFDPLLNYLDGLEWDGKPRLDGWLVRYAHASDTPLNRAFGRKVLIAAVRRARVPGCKFDYLLVLEGAQGIGKSSMIHILAGGDEFYSDKPILGLETREQQEAIQGVWLYEIGELQGLSKIDLNWMKGFLSRTHDKARPAFGRHVVDKPRRCIFIGSTNDENYLRDPTGNRRWWPVGWLSDAIDLDGIARDRDQLWAEAVAVEALGEPLTIPQELWAAAAIEQAARMEIDAWQEPIANKLISLESKRKDYEGQFSASAKDAQCRLEFRVSSNYLLHTVLGFSTHPDAIGNRETKRLKDVMQTLGYRLSPTSVKIGKKGCRAYVKLQPIEEE
jgi:hypothetical protein